jgi:hypothetical protein
MMPRHEGPHVARSPDRSRSAGWLRQRRKRRLPGWLASRWSRCAQDPHSGGRPPQASPQCRRLLGGERHHDDSRHRHSWREDHGRRAPRAGAARTMELDCAPAPRQQQGDGQGHAERRAAGQEGDHGHPRKERRGSRTGSPRSRSRKRSGSTRTCCIAANDEDDRAGRRSLHERHVRQLGGQYGVPTRGKHERAGWCDGGMRRRHLQLQRIQKRHLLPPRRRQKLALARAG